MQRVMSHERDNKEGQHGKRQERQPNTPKGVHKRGNDSVVPTLGEMLQLVEIVPDALNLLGGVGLVSEPIPEAVEEDVLVHGGPDSDANGTT